MRWRTHNEVTLRLWHDCFCIRPRKVHNTWVWFENVKRKGVMHSECWTDFAGFPRVRSRMTWEYELPEVWKSNRCYPS